MKHILPFIFLTLPLFTSAQNLVINPSFEDSLQCPSGSGAFVNYVATWTKPSYGSADYFYTGCPVSPTDEPPRTGNACAGIIVYDPANIREYMTGHLSSPLIAGTIYSISFYVCLNSSSMDAISEIGAYCTSTNISNANANPIILTATVQGSTPYTSQNGWQLVQGTFTATGGEQYLILGCFVPDSMMTFTNVQSSGWGDVYYYIDDVCLSVESQACTFTTGLAEKPLMSPVNAAPNPSSGNTTISFSNPHQEVFTLLLLNSQGQIIRRETGITGSEFEIERNGLAAGLYFVRLESAERKLQGKLVLE
jgi:hypothetical protein